MNGGDEDVVSIRGGIEGFVIGGLTDGRDGEGDGIDESELGEREVIEQILVVCAAEGVTIFVGTALAFLPAVSWILGPASPFSSCGGLSLDSGTSLTRRVF